MPAFDEDALSEESLKDGRREFVRLLVFLGTGAALAACGGGSTDSSSNQQPPPPPPPPPGDCAANGAKAGSISFNHGHLLTVPKDDFSAGIDQTYHIQGNATHDHTITLTAAQLATILADGPVSVTSTVTNDHSHQVAVICA